MAKRDSASSSDDKEIDEYELSEDPVSRWADQTTGASLTAENEDPAVPAAPQMPTLEPIPMDLVEGELDRAERGEAVDDNVISQIVDPEETTGERKERLREQKMKRKREEEDQDFQTQSQNISDRVKNKSSQTEMTKTATMRKEEVRNNTRRSGRNPGLEGPFEGAATRHKVKIVKWEDLNNEKKREIARRSEGKFKTSRPSGAERNKRKEQIERQAREAVLERRRREEREEKERESRRDESGHRGSGRGVSPIRQTPRMNLERTILERAPQFGRRPPPRQFVTSTVRPKKWNWHHGHRRPGEDLRDIINLKETTRANEQWHQERKERERKEAERKEKERKEEERKRKEKEEKERKERKEEEEKQASKKAKMDPWKGMRKKMEEDMEWIRSSNWGRKQSEEEIIQGREKAAKELFAYFDECLDWLVKADRANEAEMQKMKETQKKQQEYLRERRGKAERERKEKEKERERSSKEEEKERSRREGSKSSRSSKREERGSSKSSRSSKRDERESSKSSRSSQKERKERSRREEEDMDVDASPRKEKKKEKESDPEPQPGPSGLSMPRPRSSRKSESSSDEEPATATSINASAERREREEEEEEKRKMDRAMEMAQDYSHETGELDQLRLAGMFEMFRESLDLHLDAREKKRKEERRERRKAREEEEEKKRKEKKKRD